MKTARIVITTIFVCLLLAGVASAGIEGFRGILWGTNVKDIPGMVLVDKDDKGQAMYSRKGDSMKIGAAKLRNVRYVFWQDRFSGMYITTEGYVNWTALKSAVFEKYGKGRQSNQYIESYVWLDGSSAYDGLASLSYNEFTEKGILVLGSAGIAREQEAYEANKAKKGAKEDF